MIAGDMRASIALLSAAATATGAFALPQASGPRNLAMGGTGVASSDPWTAAFANPALTRFRDERTGLSVALPFVTATARDDDELLDAVDDFQETLDTLKAQIDADAMDPDACSVALTQLQGLEGRAVNGEAEIGFAALAPMEDYSAALWMRVRGEGRAFPDIAASDLATIGNTSGSSADLEDLDSEAVLIAAQRTEFGATIAVEGALGSSADAPRLSFGITPKVQWIETYNYAAGVTVEDGNALDDFQDEQYRRSSSVNLDLGVAPSSVKERSSASRFATYSAGPSHIATGAAVRLPRSAADDTGVAERAGLGSRPTSPHAHAQLGVPASQFFRMGVEANVFGQAQLRAGFAHDFEDGQSDLLSFGLGLSPAETVRVDLLGQFGDNAVGAGLQIALTL